MEDVARLYHEACEPTKGLPWVRRAIDRALVAKRSDDVVQFHHWLQDLLGLAGASADDRAREGLALDLRLLMTPGGAFPQQRLLLEEVLALSPSIPLRWMVEARMVQCQLELDRKEGARALRAFEEELARAPEEAPREVRARLAIARAWLNFRLADWPVVLSTAEETLSLLGPSDDPQDRGRALYYGGWALWKLERRGEAETWLARLREIAEGPGGHWWIEGVYGSLGGALGLSKGDLRSAQGSLEAGLSGNRRGGAPWGVTIALLNLSLVLDLRGDLGMALRAVSEARESAQRVRYTGGLVSADCIRGRILLHSRQVQEARTLLSDALSHAHELGDSSREAGCRLELADALLCDGDPQGSLSEVDRVGPAKSLSIEDQHRPALVRAWAHEGLENSEEARICLEGAEKEARAMGNSLAEAQVRACISRWEHQHGDVRRAHALRTEADALFDRCGVLPGGWIRDWPPRARLPNVARNEREHA